MPAPLQKRWDNVFKDVKEEEQVFRLEPRVRKTVGSWVYGQVLKGSE